MRRRRVGRPTRQRRDRSPREAPGPIAAPVPSRASALVRRRTAPARCRRCTPAEQRLRRIPFRRLDPFSQYFPIVEATLPTRPGWASGAVSVMHVARRPVRAIPCLPRRRTVWRSASRRSESAHCSSHCRSGKRRPRRSLARRERLPASSRHGVDELTSSQRTLGSAIADTIRSPAPCQRGERAKTPPRWFELDEAVVALSHRCPSVGGTRARAVARVSFGRGDRQPSTRAALRRELLDRARCSTIDELAFPSAVSSPTSRIARISRRRDLIRAVGALGRG